MARKNKTTISNAKKWRKKKSKKKESKKKERNTQKFFSYLFHGPNDIRSRIQHILEKKLLLPVSSVACQYHIVQIKSSSTNSKYFLHASTIGILHAFANPLEVHRYRYVCGRKSTSMERESPAVIFHMILGTQSAHFWTRWIIKVELIHKVSKIFIRWQKKLLELLICCTFDHLPKI